MSSNSPGASPDSTGTATTVLAAIRGALAESIDPAAAHGPWRPPAPVDALRVLAVLGPVLKVEFARAAAASGHSPMRAVAFAHFAEELYRISGLGQLLAAGACLESDAHTSADEPLAALNSVLEHREGYAAGAIDLPVDRGIPAGRKLLARDTADLLKTRLNLTYFQAKQRVDSYRELLPQQGPNGETMAPRYPRLGKILQESAADPNLLASAAGKLNALGPSVQAQPDPAGAAAELEARAARTVTEHDAGTVGRMFRDAAVRLDETAIERDAAHMQPFLGLRFRGRKPTGYRWELTTDAEGHELLTTLADDLNNPRTGSGGLPAALPAVAQPQPALIPEWAVNPDTPLNQRPRAGFTDVGQGPAAPEPAPGPGESPADAHARARAQRLLQAVLDAIRKGPASGGSQDPAAPMDSRVEMLVMIDYDSLVGRSQTPGLTGHGEYLAAATARRLACNAGILPLVMGGNSQPLDVGRRRRFFSKSQKRAIAARDRGCIHPGCSMGVNRTEAHHLDPWSAGGRTRVNNGVLLCVGCHTAYHAGHFEIVFIERIPYVLQNASRDPQRRPLRNRVFHPESAVA